MQWRVATGQCSVQWPLPRAFYEFFCLNVSELRTEKDVNLC